MTIFVKDGDVYNAMADSSISIANSLPGGMYTVGQHPMSKEYSLKTIDPYTVSGKLYGDVEARARRIMNTFHDRPSSTGVLLSGEKGTGKTMLAKLLSLYGVEQGMPTIVVNEPHHGEKFNRFMQLINQPTVVIFDEFEKVYDDRDAQNAMLTLLDGVYPSKKLFILTTNDKYAVNRHMLNRPGRLYYLIEYKGLDSAFITEYCNDNLKDKTQIDDILRVASAFNEFNFDMLKALVEEINRYGETAKQAIALMNIKREGNKGTYDLKLTVNGVEPVVYTKAWNGDPFDGVYMYYNMTTDTDNETSLHMYYQNIVSLTAREVVFKQGDFVLVLTKVLEKQYTFF